MKKLLLEINKNTKLQKNLETLLFVCKVVKFTKDGKKCYENNLYSLNMVLNNYKVFE